MVDTTNKGAFTKGLVELAQRDKELGARLCVKFRKEVTTELGISRQYFHAMSKGEKPANGMTIDRIEYIERKFKEYGIAQPWGLA